MWKARSLTASRKTFAAFRKRLRKPASICRMRPCSSIRASTGTRPCKISRRTSIARSPRSRRAYPPRRESGGCHGSGRRCDAVDREADDQEHADEQHPLSGRHVGPNRARRPSHSAALSRRRRAAGTRRCRRAPARPRRVPRADRPVADQHGADAEHGREAGAGVQRHGPPAHLGQGQRPVDRHGVLGDAGRGPGGRPVLNVTTPTVSQHRRRRPRAAPCPISFPIGQGRPSFP